jgi:LmbE family N-acetylglucosaminyl deacetylase
LQLKSFNDITRHSRHIFLAPHLDDVVYSCGGTLGLQASCGLHPLVITVFAGSPPPGTELSSFAQQIHKRMGFRQDIGVEEVVATRRKEDARALDYLYADYFWLDYPDAIYRGMPAYEPDKSAPLRGLLDKSGVYVLDKSALYYTQERDLIGEVNPGDMWIDKQLAQDLVTLHERLPDVVWYAPLGVGQHVDHQIVCSAADRLTQRGANVKLYEDFPYVLREGALEERIKELGGALEPAFVEMSEMLHLRQEAAEMYSSQIKLNFPDRQAMYQTMKDYTHRIRSTETVHLERYWTAG